MAVLWGKTLSRAEILRRVGDIRQLARVEPIELVDGSERGVRAVRLRNARWFGAGRGQRPGDGDHRPGVPGRAAGLSDRGWDGAPGVYRAARSGLAAHLAGRVSDPLRADAGGLAL